MRHQVSQLKVSISTLGCKSNQYDSSALEDALRHASLSVVPFPGPADAYIINTCTVTGSMPRRASAA
jgi:threonylcarbamoyladenosine tRNA methylthiotransferase MtaB